jgi:hypothetical protein
MQAAKTAHQVETRRQWISGLAITLTALICLFAFWRLAPGATLSVAIVALAALVVFFWLEGRPR